MRSFVWNQILPNGNFSGGTDNWVIVNSSAVSVSINDGVCRLTKGSYTTHGGAIANTTLLTANHTYYWSFDSRISDSQYTAWSCLSTNTTGVNYLAGSVTAYMDTLYGRAKKTYKPLEACYLEIIAGYGSTPAGVYADFKNVQIFDLTQMFGTDEQIAAALGCTVAAITTNVGADAFEAMFSADYYPYNTGELLNANADGIKATDPVLGTSTVDISSWQNLKDPSDPSKLLFPYGLCSVGNVHDEVSATTAIRRIGSVDWDTIGMSYQYGHFYLGTNAKIPTSTAVAGNAISSLYAIYPYSDIQTSSVAIGVGINATGNVVINNNNYTDVATFKAAMSSVMLYYELATPIVVDLPRRQDYSYPVSLQTVESVVPSNDVISAGETKPYTAPVITTNTYSGIHQPYRAVEYIESTGTQYIDTGIIPSGVTTWVLDNEFTQINSRNSFNGIYRNGPVMRFDIALQANGLVLNYGDTNNVNDDTSLFLNERYVYFLDQSNNTWGYNNINGTFSASTKYPIGKTIFIFARNDANGVDRFSSQKTYASKLYNNGVMVQYLVPCQDLNGVICMYDKVSERFFYNQGTGDFIAGPIVT